MASRTAAASWVGGRNRRNPTVWPAAKSTSSTAAMRYSNVAFIIAPVRTLLGLFRLLQSVLQRSRWTACHLRRDGGGGGELGADPALAPHVEHGGQSAHAHTGVDAQRGVERDGDAGSLVHLEAFGHT